MDRSAPDPRERGAELSPDPRERGSMAVELVLLTPVLLAFICLIAAFGRYVGVRGEIEAAARDAVRSASLERSSSAAASAAGRTAAAQLGKDTRCGPAGLGGSFTRGGIIRVTLTCQVSFAGLGLIGLPGSTTVTATSQAPLDTFRRVG